MFVRMSLGFLPVAGLISTAGTGQNSGRATLATTCAFPRAENVTAAVVAARVPLQNTDKARSGTGFLLPGGTTSTATLAASRPSACSTTVPCVIFHGRLPAVTPKIGGAGGEDHRRGGAGRRRRRGNPAKNRPAAEGHRYRA